MANITTYIHWMGKLSFQQSSFSEFDAIALATFTYLDLGDLVAEDEVISLSNAVTRLEEKKSSVFLSLDWGIKKRSYAAFLKAIFSAPRYKDIKIVNYTNKNDIKQHVQFAAMTFLLDDGTQLVSYRGTDDTLVGWKEDFMFSFTRVPAQELALQYLKDVIATGRKTYVTGHSKGGCLAEYATLFVDESERANILHAYLLDSPGLCEDVYPNVDIHAIDPLVSAIEPEYDVVASIFDHDWSDKKIVASDEKGIMQHGMLSWIIDEGNFILRRQNDRSSTWATDVVMSWLKDVSTEEREGFVNDLFKALTKHGEKSVWDLGKNPTRVFDSVLVSYFGATRRRKKTVGKLGLYLVLGTNIRSFIKRKKSKFFDLIFTNVFQGVLMAVLGVIFLVVPSVAMPYIAAGIMSIIVLAMTVLTIVSLAQEKWDFYGQRMRIALTILMLLLYASLWVKLDFLVSFSNTVFGIFFVIFAMWLSENLEYSRLKSKFDFIWNILEIVLYGVTGAFFIFAPESLIVIGVFTIGTVLISDGIYRLIR